MLHLHGFGSDPTFCLCSQWSDEYDSGSESAQDDGPPQAKQPSASDAALADTADAGAAHSQFPVRSHPLPC